jgi:ubiquinone/menaquinone biosynthesis C-methylase UbiE
MKLSPTACDGVLSPYKENIVERFGGKIILDVGCNTGQLVDSCIRSGKKAFGVEPDFILLTNSFDQAGGRLVQSDGEALPFSSNSFDTVVLWNVLEHVEDEEMAISEALRVCRSNIIIVVPKEDDISTTLSAVTYRHYVDLSHKRYYTKDSLQVLFDKYNAQMTYYEETSRIRPLMAYVEIGIPRIVCALLDRIFWFVSSKSAPDAHNSFLSVLVCVAKKGADS